MVRLSASSSATEKVTISRTNIYTTEQIDVPLNWKLMDSDDLTWTITSNFYIYYVHFSFKFCTNRKLSTGKYLGKFIENQLKAKKMEKVKEGKKLINF